jgi:hypothetical protein
VNFVRALREVAAFLDPRGFRHAVVGGVGLAALGLPRATIDLDFVVDAAAQEPLIAHLESDGFETLHRSRGYSNHLHPEAERGRLDFVYVVGETAAAIFGSALDLEGPGGLPMRVPRPEHLAAMKVHAMKNDPERSLQEMADIRFLLTLPGVDRDVVRERFERAGLADRYREIEATL